MNSNSTKEHAQQVNILLLRSAHAEMCRIAKLEGIPTYKVYRRAITQYLESVRRNQVKTRT